MLESNNLIHPLKLGNKTFPVNLIQGPLAGVSVAPFRLMCWKYSHPAFSCTEMIACKALIYGLPASQKRFITKAKDEGPVCFQLLGNIPQELGEITKVVTDYGADLVDLNCGCSVKKVRNKDEGSRLLTDPARLYKLITAMKSNTHLPVSIKIRVDGKSNDNLNKEIAKVVSEAGTDFLVVHGRNWREHYNVPCRYDDIRFFVEELKIPVIGNGDVACFESLKKMLATGCAGAMIGRAGIGQPWLIGKLIAAARGEEFTAPSGKEIGAIFLEQVETLMSFFGNERGTIFQARKLSNYYARSLRYRKEIYAAVNCCNNFADLKNICERYFV